MANEKLNSLQCLWFARHLPSHLAVDSVQGVNYTVLQFFSILFQTFMIGMEMFSILVPYLGPISNLLLWKEKEYSLSVVLCCRSIVRVSKENLKSVGKKTAEVRSVEVG